MALVFALLAAATAQEPVLSEGRAWLSIQLVEVSATAPDTRARGAFTPKIDWQIWRPLGFDDQGPYGRIERLEVQQVPGDRCLRLEVERDEFVDIAAHGPSHGIAELRVAPDTARIVGG